MEKSPSVRFLSMMAVAAVLFVNVAIGARQEINSLSADDLQLFRDNMARIQQSGEFMEIAMDHGIPNAYCPHGSNKFLIWHRRFLQRMEVALNFSLPYWDWTKGNGIPKALSARTYVNAAGQKTKNPLYSGQKYGGGSTVRQPIRDFGPGQLSNQVNMAMSKTDFIEFSSIVEGAHNDIHGDIGGDMNTLDFSSYDPVFWLHHMNCDRIWYRWQRRNKFAIYPDDARDVMADSLGEFMGEAMIADLSGWTSSSNPPLADGQPIMNKNGELSTKETPPGQKQFTVLEDDHKSGNFSHGRVNTSLTWPLGHMHSIRAPLQIEENIPDDNSTWTESDSPSYRVRPRVVMALLDMASSREALRVEILLKGVMIAWVNVFGMGKSGMNYTIDRPVDITQPYHDVLKECELGQVRDHIVFNTINLTTGAITNTEYDIGMAPMMF